MKWQSFSLVFLGFFFIYVMLQFLHRWWRSKSFQLHSIGAKVIFPRWTHSNPEENLSTSCLPTTKRRWCALLPKWYWSFSYNYTPWKMSTRLLGGCGNVEAAGFDEWRPISSHSGGLICSKVEVFIVTNTFMSCEGHPLTSFQTC